MKPKVDDIWNLHARLSKVDLEFFVTLSSMVGVAGDPSQAAYVAASIFQDAIIDYRNYHGLPAFTLDLGKVVDRVAHESVTRKAAQRLAYGNSFARHSR